MIDPARLLPAAPTLTTERLRLRALVAEDAAALFEVFAHPEAMKFWSGPPHADVAVTAGMIAGILARFAGGEGVEWAIVRNGDGTGTGTVVGKIGLWRWQREHSRGEVGHILRRDLWGLGLAGEALAAVLAFGFGTLGLHSVEAQLDAENAASVRTLERAGFRKEGLLRESYWDGQRGEWRDTAVYGLLERAWWKRKGERAGEATRVPSTRT